MQRLPKSKIDYIAIFILFLWNKMVHNLSTFFKIAFLTLTPVVRNVSIYTQTAAFSNERMSNKIIKCILYYLSFVTDV